MDASADNEAVTCLAFAREVWVNWSASFFLGPDHGPDAT